MDDSFDVVLVNLTLFLSVGMEMLPRTGKESLNKTLEFNVFSVGEKGSSGYEQCDDLVANSL